MKGFFGRQLANVIEWDEFREDMIFWKWPNNEVKKGSKLIIRPGQDAIFFHQGRIEGIFEKEGEYDIDSDIIPFLSTLKGVKYGFNSGMRVEVLFINTKEFTVKWGTQNAINIPTPQLSGGLPIRANGTFNFKVNDYVALIDRISGMKKSYLVEDVKIRITSVLDQLLMKWISREGKDMFNLQANSFEISKGIQDDLDRHMFDLGMTITGFNVMSFNYPKEIQDRITQAASHSMIDDVDKYQKVEMTDGISSGKVSGGGSAGDMAGMMMGMSMAKEMLDDSKEKKQEAKQEQNSGEEKGNIPNFCPNCGEKTTGGNFCSNCGEKLA